jgi:hypothetical protein
MKSKIMRLQFVDGRPEVERGIGRFRDSGRGYRVQARNGRDLGFFGPDEYKRIVFDIQFGKSSHTSKRQRVGTDRPTKGS